MHKAGDDDELCYNRSTYEGCRTALAYIYRMSVSSELKNQLKHFTEDLKRSIATEKRETDQNLDEGKQRMFFETYQKIAELMFKKGGSGYIFE